MRATTLDVLKTYWQSLREHKLLLFFMSVALIGASIADLGAPIYYKYFFDTLALGPAEGVIDRLVRFLFIILSIHLLAWLGWRYASFMNNFLEAKIMSDLKERAFNYLLDHSYGFFAGSFAGALVQKINRL